VWSLASVCGGASVRTCVVGVDGGGVGVCGLFTGVFVCVVWWGRISRVGYLFNLLLNCAYFFVALFG